MWTYNNESGQMKTADCRLDIVGGSSDIGIGVSPTSKFVETG